MKKMNEKQFKNWYNAYCKSTAYTLKDVYRKPSATKQSIFADCKERMTKFGGSDARILGHNTDYFTFGYRVKDTFVVETYANTYYHPI